MGHKEERLFTALEVAAEQRMQDFNSQDLANTAWAFATVGHKEERLFAALAVSAEQPLKSPRINNQRLGLSISRFLFVLFLLLFLSEHQNVVFHGAARVSY